MVRQLAEDVSTSFTEDSLLHHISDAGLDLVKFGKVRSQVEYTVTCTCACTCTFFCIFTCTYTCTYIYM